MRNLSSDFLAYNDQLYQREDKCEGCDYDCSEESKCEGCLDKKHYKEIERDYDCANMRCFYVGKYFHKYASEIGKLFLSAPAFFDSHKELNIISLGCGPCCDYYGIKKAVDTLNKDNRINYTAVSYTHLTLPTT